MVNKIKEYYCQNFSYLFILLDPLSINCKITSFEFETSQQFDVDFILPPIVPNRWSDWFWKCFTTNFKEILNFKLD